MSSDEWAKLTTFLTEAPERYRSTDAPVKEPEMSFIIITSEEYLDSVDEIKKDIRKEISYPIAFGICAKHDWEAAWRSAHALALLLQEKDVECLCKVIQTEIRS